MAGDPDCEVAHGRGCRMFVDEYEPACGSDSGDSADTGSEPPTAYVHGSRACAHVEGGWVLGLVAILAILSRRLAWGFLLLPLVAEAEEYPGADAQQLLSLDAGPSVAGVEADVGARNSARVGAVVSYAEDPALLRYARRDYELLGDVTTLGIGGSWRLGDGPRAGAYLPIHRYHFEGEAGSTTGDARVFLLVPLYEPGRIPISASFFLSATLPTGDEWVYLGEQVGGFDALFAWGWRLDGWEAVANLGMHLATTVDLPGLAWGNRMRWSLAGIARPAAWFILSAEAWGAAPMQRQDHYEAAVTSEFMLGAGPCHRAGVCVRAAGGGGLTTGLGAPAYRGALVVDFRGYGELDTDADGILDRRDECIEVPEDKDRVQDRDGCPEDDADADGLFDPVDVCPLAAETVNGVLDGDGCPDAATTLVATVHLDPEVGVEVATVGVGGTELTVFAGEPLSSPVTPGRQQARVSAEGHHPWTGDIVAAEGEARTLEVTLVAIRHGTVRLVLTTPDGAALAGAASVAGASQAVPVEGLELVFPDGPVSFRVAAPGHASKLIALELAPRERREVVVALAPLGVRVDGNRVVTEQSIGFELDRAELTVEAGPIIDEIADLLRSRPDIELLRVEGHADASGHSRHNLDLSRARAQSVVDALVDRGIDMSRLEAIGSGESREAGAARTVDFLVLVWADGG